MAKIGLNNFRYSILTEAPDGTPSYDGARKPARAISCSVSISNNSAKLFADDGLAESDTSFQSGTVTIGIDHEDQETMATLLGHEVVDDVMIRKATDVAPYVALGRVIVMMLNGAYKYKVEFLHKVKFSEPSQENNTKGESLEFGTYTMEGIVSQLANDEWSKTKTFDNKEDAIAWLESLMVDDSGDSGDDTPATTFTITYDLNGGTGDIAPVTVNEGESIELNDGTGITPPTDMEFIGWALSSTSQSATVDSPYTPTADKTLYAVYQAI